MTPEEIVDYLLASPTPRHGDRSPEEHWYACEYPERPLKDNEPWRADLRCPGCLIGLAAAVHHGTIRGAIWGWEMLSVSDIKATVELLVQLNRQWSPAE